jgi:hypothetical protein
MWRDKRQAIGLCYDLLAYAASRLIDNDSDMRSFFRGIEPFRAGSTLRITTMDQSGSAAARVRNQLVQLEDQFTDFDFAPHPEQSPAWLALADIGGLMGRGCVRLLDVDSDFGSLTGAITRLAHEPWVDPRHVSEIVAIRRWKDATGKNPPSGDRWLAFQTMIDVEEYDAAYIFASGRPVHVPTTLYGILG